MIEIDAASHGGVDDARDLRERAFFAPASSRFKIYIVDEAHMVTTQGFNALLKLVEEPPEHVKFVFATTEPEKVIGTIRSRTHHYPFRLVPPGTLTAYLADLCVRENIAVDAAVLPLVVRAGGGSVRDSLSVLDQLLAGAGGGRRDVPDGDRAARLHRCQPARRHRRRVRGRRRRGGVRARGPGGRGRARPAAVRHRPAGPDPRPDPGRRRARRDREGPRGRAAGAARRAARVRPRASAEPSWSAPPRS